MTIEPDASLQPLKLKISAHDAIQQLEKQIDRGDSISRMLHDSPYELESLKIRESAWSESSTNVIHKIFDIRVGDPADYALSKFRGINTSYRIRVIATQSMSSITAAKDDLVSFLADKKSVLTNLIAELQKETVIPPISAVSFPTYSFPALTREDVIDYLSVYALRGWKIFQSPRNSNEFIITLDEVERIWITFGISNNDIDSWAVSSGINKFNKMWGYPETVAAIDLLLSQAVEMWSKNNSVDVKWSDSPRSVRFAENTPASNYITLARLTRSATIEAIHDPYLDDKALANLLILVNLGIKLSPTIRFLVSNGNANKLSPMFVAKWKAELASSAEIRKDVTGKPHRRFMLLSSGQSLLLGMSLNSLEKNEAAHVEPDHNDRSLFENIWNNAQPI